MANSTALPGDSALRMEYPRGQHFHGTVIDLSAAREVFGLRSKRIPSIDNGTTESLVPGPQACMTAAYLASRLWQATTDDVVEGLPEGIDTIVGAGFGGATDLSGGQWQRQALARLLYHDALLIILDEPSASLDPVGERQIFALLKTLAQEKIILFTTHRYDTIRQADRIVVLVDGRIAESGTHEELERQAGAFWSLNLGQGTYPGAAS